MGQARFMLITHCPLPLPSQARLCLSHLSRPRVYLGSFLLLPGCAQGLTSSRVPCTLFCPHGVTAGPRDEVCPGRATGHGTKGACWSHLDVIVTKPSQIPNFPGSAGLFLADATRKAVRRITLCCPASVSSVVDFHGFGAAFLWRTWGLLAAL